MEGAIDSVEGGGRGERVCRVGIGSVGGWRKGEGSGPDLRDMVGGTLGWSLIDCWSSGCRWDVIGELALLDTDDGTVYEDQESDEVNNRDSTVALCGS